MAKPVIKRRAGSRGKQAMDKERITFFSVLNANFRPNNDLPGLERARAASYKALLKQAQTDADYRKKLLFYGDEWAEVSKNGRGSARLMVDRWEKFKADLLNLDALQRELVQIAQLAENDPGYDAKTNFLRGRKVGTTRRLMNAGKVNLDVTNKKDVQKTDKKPTEGETMAQGQIKPTFDKAAITTEFMSVLKEAREDQGLSQSELGLLTKSQGVSVSDIKKLESPNSQFNVPLYKVNTIAEALGFKINLTKS